MDHQPVEAVLCTHGSGLFAERVEVEGIHRSEGGIGGVHAAGVPASSPVRLWGKRAEPALDGVGANVGCDGIEGVDDKPVVTLNPDARRRTHLDGATQ